MSDLPKEMADYEAYKSAMSIVKPVDAIEAFIKHISSSLAHHISRKITSLVTRKPYSTYRSASDNIEVKDVVIADVPVRIYKPTDLKENEKLPAIVFVHGGFWQISSVEDYDQITYTLAKRTRALVASVDYKLAPEYKYPVALNEVHLVSKELINHVDDYSIDRSRIAICGDSTGGNMVAAVVHRLSQEKINIKWQCLLQAPLQFVDLTLPSYQQNVAANHLNILSYPGLNRFLSEYINVTLHPEVISINGHVSDRFKSKLKENQYLSWKYIPQKYCDKYKQLPPTTAARPLDDTSLLFNEDVSPLMANDETLRSCPNTLLVTSEYDIFRDDSYIYAGRLNSLGVKAEVKNYEDGYHGALNFYQDDKYKFPKIFLQRFCGVYNKQLVNNSHKLKEEPHLNNNLRLNVEYLSYFVFYNSFFRIIFILNKR